MRQNGNKSRTFILTWNKLMARVLQLCWTVLILFISSHSLADDKPREETAAKTDEADVTTKSEGGNFLLLPIFITEPSIGEGLGLGLVYFHEQDDIERPKVLTGETIVRTARRSVPPPTVTGVFAAYTNNDTAAIGIGHARSMKHDKYRLVGAMADMTVNSTTFVSDIPFDFKLDGKLAFTSIKRRFGESNVFLGLSLSTLDANVASDLDHLFCTL